MVTFSKIKNVLHGYIFFCFAVRNRAKELVELLADVDKIRQERKKAKANRSKYVGTGNDSLSFGSGRYGGFGSESYGGGYSGDYGVNASGYDRGAFLASSSWAYHPHPKTEYSGGGSSSGFRDNVSRGTEFEEYDAGDDETSARRTTSTTSQIRSPTTQSKATGKAPEPVPAPVMNLLDFDDSEPAAGSSAAAATEKALPALAPLGATENGASLLLVTNVDACQPTVSTAGGEDDFADFQAAPSSPPAAATATTRPLAASPVAAAAAAKPNLMDLLASTSSPATSKPQPQSFGVLNAALAAPSSQVRPSSTPATAPAYAGMPAMTPTLARSAVTSPVSTASPSLATTSTKRGGSGSTGGFDDLWTMSLGAAGTSKPAGGAAGAKSIRDLEKEKAQAGIWGTQNQARPPAAAVGVASSGGGFGSFVKSAVPSNSGGGAPAGADDLLL